tara:strand:- start:1467 stop:3323 length:1857 start_codon:yes stop_codon:yes gene_type:complete
MKLLDLFSGIGGFSLGAEYNNIETIGFVEKDAFCQKVLRKHWPNTPIIGDIRDVKRETFESVDIVSGGFPCQPFSVAGKRRGTDDDRYLWDETIRVVSLYKPRWFVGENVDGLVNIQNGMVLRQVQTDLEKEGFQVQCLVIPASGIGAWHQRKRVWIVGHSQHDGSSTSQEQGGYNQTSTRPQEGENSSIKSEGASRSRDNGNVSHTNDNGLEGRQFETRNEDDARKDNESLWRKSTNNISRSSDDRGNKTKPRVDEDISRPHDGNEEKPTTTTDVCEVSQESNDSGTIEQASRDKENNDRTLVQKRQMFQLSKSRGLGDDKTSSERNKIRQGDDNTVSHRVDSNDVSNTHDSRLTNRPQQHQGKSTQEREGQPSSSRQNFISKSNSNECEHTSTRQSRKNKIWRFYSEEKEQASYDLWSKTSRCDDVSGEQEDVSNSQHQRWSNESIRGHRELGEKSREKEKRGNQSALRSTTCSSERGTDEDVSNSCSERQLLRESGKLGEKSEETQGSRENNTQGFENTSARGKQDVSYTNTKRLQGHNSKPRLSEEELRFTSGKDDEKQYTWWETQSNICGVPDGVSYGLDKGRVGRIKSLGNSIVPQIAYQIFKSIKQAEEVK